MNPRPISNAGQHARFAAVTLAMLFSLSAFGQQTATAEQTTTDPENVVVLSPFVVTTEKDVGYFAENTLMGSRMNTKVSDLAASITVVTKQQLEDTGSLDINDVFLYEANTEGAGTFTPVAMNRNNLTDICGGYCSYTGDPLGIATAIRVRGLGRVDTAQNT
jgi:outer membrane receptor protein involved in Fe transport